MPLVSNGYILDSGVEDKFTEILMGEDNLPLMCALTKVDLKANANTFCIIHAIYSGTTSRYGIYTRSGRTGQTGRKSIKDCKDEDDCRKQFFAKFKLLTANVWSFRSKFEHRMGYSSVFSFGEKQIDVPVVIVKDKHEVIKRDDYIANLVNLFCSIGMSEPKIKAAMCDMDIDASKMPVGVVADRNIAMAKDILSQLGEESLTEDRIIRLSEKYYGFIPFISRGKAPPLIDSIDMIKSKLQILDDLENISITIQIISAGNTKKGTESETIDKIYASMNHTITVLPITCNTYRYISNYFTRTHCGTHRFGMKLEAIYCVHNAKKKEKFEKKYGSTGRKELLIHGSPLGNWRSILEHGLVIRPEKFGATITGKMYGNGIYWANSFSKSAQYCQGYYNRGSKGKIKICLALAEVAVGMQTDSMHCDRKKGDCCWAKGASPSSYVKDRDVYIPSGPLVGTRGNTLYDEKIIYDEDQYNFKYLVIATMN